MLASSKRYLHSYFLPNYCLHRLPSREWLMSGCVKVDLSSSKDDAGAGCLDVKEQVLVEALAA